VKSASLYAAIIIRRLWTSIAILLVVVAVALSIVRYSLPYMDSQKHRVENYLAEQYGIDLEIDHISATWSGAGPAIILRDLRVHQNSQSPIELNIAEAQVDLNFWASLLARQFQSQRFVLSGLDLTVDLGQIQTADSDFLIIDVLESLFLEQLQQFSVVSSQISLITESGKKQLIQIEQLSWVNRDNRHQGVGELRVEELTNNSASFTLDLYGEKNDLQGTFFAKGEELDLAPWLNQLIRSDETLTESRANFTFWAGIENSKLTSMQLALADSRFSWQDADSSISAKIQGGNFRASPDSDGWAFNLDELSLNIAGKENWLTNWAGHLDKQGGITLRSLDAFNLAPLMPILPLFLPQDTSQSLTKLAAQGQIDQFALSLNVQGLGTFFNFSHFSSAQLGNIPGVENVSGEFNWYGRQGQLVFAAEQGQLQINNLLDNNLDFKHLSAAVYLNMDDTGFEMFMPELSFISDTVSFTQAMSYRSAENLLALSTLVSPLLVSQAKSLFPGELMGRDTRRYLDRALLDGQVVGAQLLWHGATDDFPFDKHDGIFQAAVQVQDARFSFDTNWPELHKLQLDLLFENESLLMTSSKASLMDIQVAQLSALIPELRPGAVLSIDGKAIASGQQATALMQHSSLADSVGSTLQQVVVEGPLQTDLHLSIPLTGENVVAKGTVNFAGNPVSIPALDLKFTDTKGALTFNNALINMEQLSTHLLEQTVVVNLTGDDSEAGYKLNIDLAGDWQATPLLADTIPGFIDYLAGRANWSAELALILPEQGYDYEFSLQSGLTGIESSLPAPFNKTLDQTLPLKVVSKGNQQVSNLEILLGEQVKFNGVLPHQEKRFSRAHLAIGDSDLVSLGLGFSISAKLDEVDFIPWYGAIHALVAGLPSVEQPILAEPQRIYLEADSMLLAGQLVNDLKLVARHSDKDWALELNAKQVRANLTLYKDWLKKGVVIDADFINLDEWRDSAQTIAMQPKLATLPPLKFSCKQCSFQQKNLGRLDLELSRSAQGMHIDELRINSPNGQLSAKGDWFLSDTSSSSHLQGDFKSADIGAFLKSFGFESGVKDSKASFEFDLNWQKAPYAFNFDSLNGSVDWRLTDGYLTEVSDKGSRIFSILSLESLVRKLRLDFRDVFAKGFFYDKMKGSFQVVDGVADTRDTIIDGGAGEMTIRGYTNLPSQELNYRIAFSPKVTSSLPVIVAWMVNPATALAALALDQVLTSAKVISNIEYSLTGSIDEPVLTELGRDSKDISLPAKVAPAGQGEDPTSGFQAPPIEQPNHLGDADE
jgi:uncharacterized protein (TIGR02099 family)